jgi:hypothetical protein
MLNNNQRDRKSLSKSKSSMQAANQSQEIKKEMN